MESKWKEAIHVVNNYAKRGIILYLDEGKLKYKAQKNSLKEEDKKQLKELKQDIMTILEKEASPIRVEYDEEKRYEPFELTDVQSAYLLGRNEAFDYAGVACHIYIEQKYDYLDGKKVENVWNQLIQRHDMLRAVITEDGRQKILKDPGRLQVKCQNAENSEEEQKIIDEMRKEMGHRVYDTAKWPLFDVAVTHTQEDTILHFSIEFLIADWTSVWMLFSEFEELYYNENAVLPSLQLSFKDYLTAEKKLKSTLKYAADEEYWMNRIDTLPTAPQLPLKNIAEDKPLFKRFQLHIDKDKLDTFELFAKEEGLTVTSGVLGAYSAVIEKWSMASNFTLNLTILNRLALDSQVNQIVGDFTSVNMLEVNWKADKKFSENVSEISKRLFEDLDHRTFSGVEVIREIARKRGKQDALMPIVFTSAIGLTKTVGNNVSHGRYEGNGISQTPQVFIDCQAMDREDGLWINWDVREGVFPDGMIEDMFAEFEQLLNRLCENALYWKEGNVAKLPKWQMDSREQANGTYVEYPNKFMFDGILESAEKYPDKMAIADGFERVWTYEELLTKAWSVANWLRENGVERGTRIGITMPKSALQAVSAIAILLAGGAYVPIDVNQPETRRNRIIQASGVKYVLISDSTDIDFGDRTDVINVDHISDNATHFSVDIKTEDLAYIIYTSGTTGEPKGVMISHKGAMNTIQDINTRFGITEKDSIIGLSQLGFDLSVYDIFGVLSAGGSVIYPNVSDYKNPAHWYALMKEYSITLWNSVPAFFRMFLSFLKTENTICLDAFRLSLLSGDWIPTEVPEITRKLLPKVKLVSLGGATEASIWSIYYEMDAVDSSWKSVPYGKPLANQTFYIKAKDKTDCPVYVSGDLYIGGDGLALGYAGDKELTDKKFINCAGKRIYHTGDRGRYLPDGNIEFLGRSDDQIKIRGYRIELGEIEECIKRCKEIEDSAAVIYENGQERSIFAVFTSKQDSIDISDIMKQLTQMLPEYMMPSKIQQVERIPLTLNGKVDRKTILQYRSVDSEMVDKENRQPMNKVQKMVYEILSQALGTKELKENDNLYHFGADSLIIAQAVGNIKSEVTNRYGVEIAFDLLLREIINHPNILSISTFIEDCIGKKEENTTASSMEDKEKYCSLNFFGKEDNNRLRVLMHGGLGSTNCFNKVIPYLEQQKLGNIACVNVADTNIYCSTEPSELIDIYSNEYAKCIAKTGCEKVQIIGYSIGGMLAVETARHLVECGVEVEDMVLIDIPPMLYTSDDELLKEMLFVMNMNVSFKECGFLELTNDMVMAGIMKVLQNGESDFGKHCLEQLSGTPELDHAGKVFTSVAAVPQNERMCRYAKAVSASRGETVSPEMIMLYFKIFSQSLQAVNYTPDNYIGDIRFFEAATPFIPDKKFSESVHKFWEDICIGDVTFVPVRGNHFTCVENDEYAAELANKLADIPT